MRRKVIQSREIGANRQAPRQVSHFVLNAREIAALSPVVAALPAHQRVRETVRRLQAAGIDARTQGPEALFPGDLDPDSIESAVREISAAD